MAKTRDRVVSEAKKYLGYSEKNGKYKTIIDIYNAHKPLAVGYKVKYTDEWCAAFVSAISILCGITDIMPTECSCSRMITLYKKLGCWVEDDSYTPKPGDLIMYDWEDNGRGDNVGAPNHVGIVTSVSGSKLVVIEGNKNEAVSYRELNVNGRYIRGYCVPAYEKKDTPDPWYSEAQKWVIEKGISDGTRPTDTATRAEVWAMIHRFKG